MRVLSDRRRSMDADLWMFTQLAFVPMLGVEVCPEVGDTGVEPNLCRSREDEGRRDGGVGVVCADLDLKGKNGLFFGGEIEISSDTGSTNFLRLLSLFLDIDLALSPLKNFLVGRRVGTGDADDDDVLGGALVTPVYAFRRFSEASLFNLSLNLLPDFSKKWTLPFRGLTDASTTEESFTSGLNIHSAIWLPLSKAPSSANTSNTEALKDDVR